MKNKSIITLIVFLLSFVGVYAAGPRMYSRIAVPTNWAVNSSYSEQEKQVLNQELMRMKGNLGKVFSPWETGWDNFKLKYSYTDPKLDSELYEYYKTGEEDFGWTEMVTLKKWNKIKANKNNAVNKVKAIVNFQKKQYEQRGLVVKYIKEDLNKSGTYLMVIAIPNIEGKNIEIIISKSYVDNGEIKTVLYTNKLPIYSERTDQNIVETAKDIRVMSSFVNERNFISYFTSHNFTFPKK